MFEPYNGKSHKDYVLEAYVTQLQKEGRDEDYVFSEFASIYNHLFNKGLNFEKGSKRSYDILPLKLPRRELRVLEYLDAHVGRWNESDRVASYVFDDDYDTWPVNIQSHISKLRYKLHNIGLTIMSRRYQGYQLASLGNHFVSSNGKVIPLLEDIKHKHIQHKNNLSKDKINESRSFESVLDSRSISG